MSAVTTSIQHFTVFLSRALGKKKIKQEEPILERKGEISVTYDMMLHITSTKKQLE